MSNPPAWQPCDPQDLSVAIPKPGRPQFLHEDEEDLIAEAATYFARNNTPLTRQNLCELTKHLAQMMPSARRRRVPFLTRPLSKARLNGFLHRRPGLSVQAVRCLASDRLKLITCANVAEHISRVQEAMRHFRIYNPHFIFNLDESGVSFKNMARRSLRKGVGPSGARLQSKAVITKGKLERVTVMCVVNDTGDPSSR